MKIKQEKLRNYPSGFLNIQEVMEITGKSYVTIYRWITQYYWLTACRIGKSWRIPKYALIELAEEIENIT